MRFVDHAGSVSRRVGWFPISMNVWEVSTTHLKPSSAGRPSAQLFPDGGGFGMLISMVYSPIKIIILIELYSYYTTLQQAAAVSRIKKVM